jgi:hypothetical protein
MTTTERQTTAFSAPTDSLRKTAVIVGVLFLVTYATSMVAKFWSYPPLFGETPYVLGDGADGRVLWGAVLEMLLIVANIGTAVYLFPVLRRQHEGLALGFVGARVMESVFIAVGAITVFTLVTVRQDLGGPQSADAAVTTVGQTLAILQEWTFVLGPGFIVGVGNGLILGYLMYRSGLVPRGMALLGLVGGLMICLSGIAVMLGYLEASSTWHLVAAIPEFFWELSLAIYLIVKGFKPSSTIARAPSDA